LRNGAALADERRDCRAKAVVASTRPGIHRRSAARAAGLPASNVRYEVGDIRSFHSPTASSMRFAKGADPRRPAKAALSEMAAVTCRRRVGAIEWPYFLSAHAIRTT